MKKGLVQAKLELDNLGILPRFIDISASPSKLKHHNCLGNTAGLLILLWLSITSARHTYIEELKRSSCQSVLWSEQRKKQVLVEGGRRCMCCADSFSLFTRQPTRVHIHPGLLEANTCMYGLLSWPCMQSSRGLLNNQHKQVTSQGTWALLRSINHTVKPLSGCSISMCGLYINWS